MRLLAAMVSGKNSVEESAEEELERGKYRLCGFVVVVVKVPEDYSSLYELVGAKCSLQGRGSDVHVHVERFGLCLRPLLAEDGVVEDGRRKLFEVTPSPQIGGDCKDVSAERPLSSVIVASGGGSSGKRKRGGGNGGGLLHHLLWLHVKNNVRVQGRILETVCKGNETRALAMLDVYLPSSSWIGSGFWKSGAAAAAALSHLSCDWEKRRTLITKLMSGEAITMSENVWDQGGCHVLGCRFHQAISESMKSQFDLHSLFKSLPTYKAEDRPEGLKLLRDEEMTGDQTGIWDVPDEVITSIFSRLLPKDLHNVAAVCRYTRWMAVPIMPCMRLRLFPHQQAAVRWMLQRENKPGLLPHPLSKNLETEDGFPFFLDTVSGELSPELPPEVRDFRGGLFCDEPGLGKTVTALSLILKTQGASADPPPGTEVNWVAQGAGERMGYYEVKSSSSSVLSGSALKRSMLLKARKNESDRVSARRLSFGDVALREAARKPKEDATRLYLSRATLIVVTQSLVEHWRHQIAKHTTPGQLRVYVWTDHKKPAAAHSLAWDYDIVITTFNRLSSEWSIRENSVLMRVQWLRIMLDEGHTLGASLSLTNKLQMAKSLHASRRWILTGTPTPNTPSSQAAYLRPMLEFLHEDLYSKQQKLWDNAILRPFEAGCEEGRSRLVQLLHRIMISSRKADLCTIPPCIRKVKLLEFTEAHGATYNDLVVTVQRNILLADWRDPSHVESLLNPKQWKLRSTTLRNTRLSCCVAGHIKVGMSGVDVHETMDVLVKEHGVVYASALYFKIQSALLHGGNCDRCQTWCRLPIITPCRHLLCLSCVAMDSEKCTMSGCGHPYKMQSPAELARPENPTPKWPVPQDLIELQPSYAQDDWDPDWHATSSSKVAYLVDQLKVIQDNNLVQQFSSDAISKAKADWSNSTMWHIYSNNNSDSSLPYKAIVFSQFLEHINVIEQQLKGAGIQHVGMYSPMPHANRMKSLVTFQNDPTCTVLVMDSSASLGLDLSFVSHVYLMEPIWDGSVEEQVVSRAHRMGATRPVLVETLAMSGTIEEQMLEYLQDSSGKGRVRDGHDSGGKTDYSLENSCLTNLNFVRTRSAAVNA